MNKNWYWIELIGFDNTKADYGVDNFLNKLNDYPEGISILFANIDFVNNFNNTLEDEYLATYECSYGGHLYGEEHKRQRWQKRELKNLIKELKKMQIKVIFGFFNLATYNDDFGVLQTTSFCKNNLELFDLDKLGNKSQGINVLKHFSNGELYENYLFNQINKIVDFFGFDGVQFGDGISSNRPSIQNGDFSDDIVNQFEKYSKIFIKNYKYKNYEQRRKFILNNFYYEWIVFLSDRWADFYKKADKILNFKDKIIVFNSVWSRDPFEALYRYGLDYTKIFNDSIYAVMVEEVSATRPILSSEDEGGFYLPLEERRYVHYESFIMQMSLKICMPTLKQLTLTPIHDTQEQWDLLRHSPMELQRAIIRRNNTKILYKNSYINCSNSPFYCLSDGVKKESWQELETLQKLSFTDEILNVLGFTFLWSSSTIYKELKEYVAKRKYTSSKILNELVSSGFQLSSMTSVDDLCNLKSPLLVINPQYLNKFEILELKKFKYPIIIVSTIKNKIIKSNYSIKDRYLNIDICNYNVKNRFKIKQKVLKCGNKFYDEQGGIWTYPLKYKKINKEYFKYLNNYINKLFCLPELISVNTECKLTTFKISNTKFIMLISNDEYTYILPKINFKKKIIKAKSLTKYDGYDVLIDNESFITRVAPRGMEIIEITIKE